MQINNIASGSLAFVKSRDTEAFSGQFFPSIHTIYDSNRNEIVRMGYMNRITELYLNPGNYTIVLLCDKGDLIAHPSVNVNLAANRSYEMYCQVAKKKSGFFGIEVIDTVSAHVTDVAPIEAQ